MLGKNLSELLRLSFMRRCSSLQIHCGNWHRAARLAARQQEVDGRPGGPSLKRAVCPSHSAEHAGWIQSGKGIRNLFDRRPVATASKTSPACCGCGVEALKAKTEIETVHGGRRCPYGPTYVQPLLA